MSRMGEVNWSGLELDKVYSINSGVRMYSGVDVRADGNALDICVDDSRSTFENRVRNW
jgi:hypothetical protein